MRSSLEVIPGVQWRPKDIGDIRALGYLSSRGPYRHGTSLREVCGSGSKAGEAEPSKPFDIRHRVTGFCVCSLFELVMYILCHCWKYIIVCLILQEEMALSLRR